MQASDAFGQEPRRRHLPGHSAQNFRMVGTANLGGGWNGQWGGAQKCHSYGYAAAMVAGEMPQLWLAALLPEGTLKLGRNWDMAPYLRNWDAITE